MNIKSTGGLTSPSGVARGGNRSPAFGGQGGVGRQLLAIRLQGLAQPLVRIERNTPTPGGSKASAAWSPFADKRGNGVKRRGPRWRSTLPIRGHPKEGVNPRWRTFFANPKSEKTSDWRLKIASCSSNPGIRARSLAVNGYMRQAQIPSAKKAGERRGFYPRPRPDNAKLGWISLEP